MAKIALIGETDWSIGSIHFFLKKYLSPYYEIDIFNWCSIPEMNRAYSGEYDIIIGEVSIASTASPQYITPPHTKIIPMFHNGCLDTNNYYFTNHYDDVDFSKYYVGVISLAIQEKVKNRYKINPNLLPIGVCPDFWEKRNITTINKLGHVSKPDHLSWGGYEEIKNHTMFLDIVKASNTPGDHVFGKHFSEGTRIYDGFDMVVCTSTNEGLPTPFLECAAAKIPFISTKVGIIPEYKSVKTFKTIEEAVDIINYLKSSPEVLKKYVDEVHEEVINDRNWKRIIIKYWKPLIEKLLNT